MKNILGLLFSLAGHSLFGRLKIEGIKLYAGLLERCRNMAVIIALAFLTLIMAMTGFIALHAAILYFLPWSATVKAFVCLGLGVLYFFGSLTAVIVLLSRRRFMSMCGLNQVAQKLAYPEEQKEKN